MKGSSVDTSDHLWRPRCGQRHAGSAYCAESRDPAVSTGDIFRHNIKNETALGLQVREILASGAYVPDEVTNAIVRDRLDQPDAVDGFLLDGYPAPRLRSPSSTRCLQLGGSPWTWFSS